MKKSFIIFTLLVSTALIQTNKLHSQNTFKFSVGLGISKLNHLDIHYQWQKFQSGISITPTLSLFGLKGYAVSADFLIYFSEITNRSLENYWYSEFTLQYVSSKPKQSIFSNKTYTYQTHIYQRDEIIANFSIGNEYPLFKAVGLDFSFGLMFLLYEKDFNKLPEQESSWPDLAGDLDTYNGPFFPTIDLTLYYKL